jgi:hypothetical protein
MKQRHPSLSFDNDLIVVAVAGVFFLTDPVRSQYVDGSSPTYGRMRGVTTPL